MDVELAFSEYLKAKDVMETKSGVTAFKNSPWVMAIADAMNRCEIEANLVEMVIESQDLNILYRYNILKNYTEGRKSLTVDCQSSPHYCLAKIMTIPLEKSVVLELWNSIILCIMYRILPNIRHSLCLFANNHTIIKEPKVPPAISPYFSHQ